MIPNTGKIDLSDWRLRRDLDGGLGLGRIGPMFLQAGATLLTENVLGRRSPNVSDVQVWNRHGAGPRV